MISNSKPVKSKRKSKIDSNGIAPDVIKRAWDVFKSRWLHYQTAKHPNVPLNCLPSFKAKGMDDNSANGITKSIVTYVTILGGHANRLNVMGTFDTRLKKFRPSATKKGTADVQIIFNSKTIMCEVKYGRDRQSPDQIKYQQQIESSGGLYFIATSFPQFWIWFQQFEKPNTTNDAV